MIHTVCPLGGSDQHDEEVYPANFSITEVNEETFSARRLPDRIHYRMVRNRQTGSLRADPILDEETVLRLYRGSRVTYESMARFSADTYMEYLPLALARLPDRRGVLEVGCGHAFFLDRLLGMEFGVVNGIEPSAEAVAKASPLVRSQIVHNPFGPGLFPQGTFSLVCGFQVLDHLIRPNDVLQACKDYLTPGGVMYWICHDVGSVLARLLGRRGPMIDIQHVVLYDRRTLLELFRKNGFEVVEVFGVSNRYPLSYWATLAPLPAQVKSRFTGLLDRTGIGRLPLRANFGNMGIIATKPCSCG
jgi:SAM-dependent methyltransferase